MKTARFLFAALATLVAAGCATTSRTASKPLTQEEIIQLAAAKTPDAEIIQKIKSSGTVYRLTTTEILFLHEKGVSNSVIDFMLQDYIESVRWQERYGYRGYYGGWYAYGPHWYWVWPPPRGPRPPR
ncbi:MAG: hypothetical protein N2689_03985 [Verrucomicrobiae bacterium]|nr:hypothetical protein [Verrucomicrobiae bacterium]